MSARQRALGAFVASSAFFVGSHALAYCRTTTCDPGRESCEVDANCIVSGRPLSWPSSCVSFSVQEDGSSRHGISATKFEQVIDSAFATWLNADCGGGRRPTLSIQGLGQVSCDATEYNQEQGNANIFMFRDTEWSTKDTGHALALTTIWFNPDSGSIYDVDVEVNGTTDDAITTGSIEDGIDLPSVLTHEIGHFLGLSHSGVGEAVMREFYDPGADDLRRLRPDDIAGICSIYKPDRPVTTRTCTPRHGFASDCASEIEGGCSMVRASGSSSVSWFTAALVGLVAGWRRRASGKRGAKA